MKPTIQTIKDLRSVLKANNIPEDAPLFFYYQSPEGAGLKSKSFEWQATGICIETDDTTGVIRIGLFSEFDPKVATVSENTEKLQ
jgi:hypothetical protein